MPVFFSPCPPLTAVPAPQRAAEEQPDQQEPEFSREPGTHLSSPVCHTKTVGGQVEAGLHGVTAAGRLLQTPERLKWKKKTILPFQKSSCTALIFFNFFHVKHLSCASFYPYDFFVNLSEGCSYACCVLLDTSSARCFLYVWIFLKSQLNTLGSYYIIIIIIFDFFCHRHRWCCWDISFCLNPSCVIKVPLLCISSPSLSENLSCPLMGVCWWVWLIVGLFVFWFVFGVYEVIFFLACSNTSDHCVVLCSTSAKKEKRRKQEKKTLLVFSFASPTAFKQNCPTGCGTFLVSL